MKRVVRACATGPHQWLTLYESGHVRLHSADLVNANRKHPYRTLEWRPTKADREAIRRLIWKLNLMAAGELGTECKVCVIVGSNGGVELPR
jgi:hypothetical protein